MSDIPIELIAFHGFMGVGADFTPLFRRLHVDGRFSMHAPDLIGHGSFQSPHPDAYTLEAQLRYWEKRIPQDAVLMGYSMGGRLALQFAIRYPNRLRGLILIGATPGIVEQGEREMRSAWDKRQATLIRQLGVEAFYEQWQKMPIIATQQQIAPEIRQQLLENRNTHSVEGLALSMECFGTGSMPACWSTLASIRVPTLLMVGELDLKYQSIAEQMVMEMPTGLATVQVIPRVGHCAHLEGLAESVDCIQCFLDEMGNVDS